MPTILLDIILEDKMKENPFFCSACNLVCTISVDEEGMKKKKEDL